MADPTTEIFNTAKGAIGNVVDPKAAPLSEQGIEAQKKEITQAQAQGGNYGAAPITYDSVLDGIAHAQELLKKMPADQILALSGLQKDVLSDIEKALPELKKSLEQKGADAWLASTQAFVQSDQTTQQALATQQQAYGFGALDFSKTVTSFLGGVGTFFKSIGIEMPMFDEWVENAKNFDTEFAQTVSYDRVTETDVDYDGRREKVGIEYDAEGLSQGVDLRLLKNRLDNYMEQIQTLSKNDRVNSSEDLRDIAKSNVTVTNEPKGDTGKEFHSRVNPVQPEVGRVQSVGDAKNDADGSAPRPGEASGF